MTIRLPRNTYIQIPSWKDSFNVLPYLQLTSIVSYVKSWGSSWRSLQPSPLGSPVVDSCRVCNLRNLVSLRGDFDCSRWLISQSNPVIIGFSSPFFDLGRVLLPQESFSYAAYFILCGLTWLSPLNTSSFFWQWLVLNALPLMWKVSKGSSSARDTSSLLLLVAFHVVHGLDGLASTSSPPQYPSPPWLQSPPLAHLHLGRDEAFW